MQVTEEEGAAFATQINANYKTTSSTNEICVINLFGEIGKVIINSYKDALSNPEDDNGEVIEENFRDDRYDKILKYFFNQKRISKSKAKKISRAGCFQ